MLGRHILLLGLHKPELPLVAVPLGVELMPFPGLLHQLRLQLRWRRRYAEGWLHRRGRGLGRGNPSPGHRSWRRHGGRCRRRRRRAAAPHRCLYYSTKSTTKQEGSTLPSPLGFGTGFWSASDAEWIAVSGDNIANLPTQVSRRRYLMDVTGIRIRIRIWISDSDEMNTAP